MAGSTSLIVILSAITLTNNSGKNGFNRNVKDSIIILSSVLKHSNAGYYFAGITPTHILLGDYYKPAKVLITDMNLKDTQSIKFIIDKPVKFAWPLSKILIDSPIVRIIEGVTPAVLQASLSTKKLEEVKYSNRYFTEAIALSQGSIIVKSNDPILNQDIVLKETTNNENIYPSKPILEKQVDGFFCTDGVLIYEKSLNKIVYVYYYRNQFICLDTSLNVLYKGNSIDTNTYSKIAVQYISKTGETTFSKPPRQINKNACISDSLLYIRSLLIADNENKKLFKSSSVFDIYSLKNGSYQFSFYIPEIMGEKVKLFKVINKVFVALYDSYIATYQING